MAAESPHVNCRITPIADICRDRPCLTERLREGATGSNGNLDRQPIRKRSFAKSVTGAREPPDSGVLHRALVEAGEMASSRNFAGCASQLCPARQGLLGHGCTWTYLMRFA